MDYLAKLSKFEERHKELEQLLSKPETLSDREKIQKYGKELSEIKEIVEKAGQFRQIGRASCRERV